MKKLLSLLLLVACQGKGIEGLEVNLTPVGSGCSEITYSYTQQDTEFLNTKNFNTVSKSAGKICAEKGDKGDSCSVRQEIFGASITCGLNTVSIFNGKDGSSCHTIQHPEGSLITCGDGSKAFVGNGVAGRDGKSIQGAQGSKGDVGAQGVQGEKGAQGDTGASCSTAQTSTGATITCGETTSILMNGKADICSVVKEGAQATITCGSDSVVVNDGRNGSNGINGRDGKDGVNGKDASNGVDGKDGKDGKDGSNGIDGSNGVDGKDGINGKDGSNGVDGKDGKDASSVAVIQLGKGSHPEYMIKVEDKCVVSFSDKKNGENTRLTVLLPTDKLETTDGSRVVVEASTLGCK